MRQVQPDAAASRLGCALSQSLRVSAPRCMAWDRDRPAVHRPWLPRAAARPPIKTTASEWSVDRAR
jgi:hypothetical protein